MADPTASRAAQILVILGAPASGKMTVGLEIARHADFTLLHNHMTIDLLTEFFEFGSPSFERLNDTFRIMILDEMSAGGRNVIVTASWRFDVPADQSVVDAYCRPFRERGGRASFVELRTDLQTRLVRNRTDRRRQAKKLDWATDDYLISQERKHRYVSENDFPYPDEHLVIVNTDLDAPRAAMLAIRHFDLPRRAMPATGHR